MAVNSSNPKALSEVHQARRLREKDREHQADKGVLAGLAVLVVRVVEESQPGQK